MARRVPGCRSGMRSGGSCRLFLSGRPSRLSCPPIIGIGGPGSFAGRRGDQESHRTGRDPRSHHGRGLLPSVQTRTDRADRGGIYRDPARGIEPNRHPFRRDASHPPCRRKNNDGKVRENCSLRGRIVRRGDSPAHRNIKGHMKGGDRDDLRIQNGPSLTHDKNFGGAFRFLFPSRENFGFGRSRRNQTVGGE